MVYKTSSACLHCEVTDARYKFRCCGNSFCSSSCFSAHTECEGPKRPSDGRGPLIERREFVRKDNADLDLSSEDVLSPSLLAGLAQDPKLVELLSNESLQDLLLRLDSARDRRRFFSRAYETNVKFRVLIDHISEALGNPI